MNSDGLDFVDCFPQEAAKNWGASMTLPLPPAASRPPYSAIEVEERRMVSQIERRMKFLLAEFDRKASAHIAEAVANIRR